MRKLSWKSDFPWNQFDYLRVSNSAIFGVKLTEKLLAKLKFYIKTSLIFQFFREINFKEDSISRIFFVKSNSWQISYVTKEFFRESIFEESKKFQFHKIFREFKCLKTWNKRKTVSRKIWVVENFINIHILLMKEAIAKSA